MWHRNRRWQVSPVESVTILARHLTEMIWVLCQGFRFRESAYLFLNDSTSPDGAQEYAVVKREGDDFPQVESITFSWCQPFEAERYIDKILAGDYDRTTLDLIDPARIESPDEHGSCLLCI